MSDLILSINSNLLKVTLITNKGEFKGITKKIPESICKDTSVLDSEKFAEFLSELFSEFLPKNKKNYSLNFLVEPENVYSEFIALPKGKHEDSDAVVEEAKKQLEGVSLNELYFVHNRLAPFMRHFVGVKKVDLERYIEISSILGMEIRSVIPWTFLLPKYADVLEPSVFAVLEEEETVITLSELNSVYFSKTFDTKLKPAELSAFVEDLSNYERTENIKKVFILGKETVKLDEKFEVVRLSLPNSGIEETKGYENHLLTHYMMDTWEDLLVSSSNALTLLPLPTTVKSPSPVVYVGGGVAVLLLIAGVVYGGMQLSKKEAPLVVEISEEIIVEENVAGAETVEEEVVVEEEQKELDKKDLSIQIENGAGIGGLAGRTSNFLKDLGYTIFDIGDAEIVGRQNTLLKFKKDKLEYAEMLKEDMKDTYLEIVVQDDLEDDVEYDLLVIVGTNIDEE